MTAPNPSEPARDAEYVRTELLAEWLLVNGFAEENRGYGHVSAEDLAVALVEEFDIRQRHQWARIDGSDGSS